jgi:vancomycin resistance protein YoaR
MTQRRPIRWAVGLGAVLALLYVAGWAATGTKMPANAEIGGVAVGGMKPAAAEAALRKALTPRLDDEIVLMHGKQRFKLDPKELGLEPDFAESVRAGGGARSWNPRDMVTMLGGKRESGLVVRADDRRVNRAVTTIAKSVNTKAVEPWIDFPKGKPVAHEPVAGVAVQKAATARAITRAYLVAAGPTRVPTSRIETTVDQAELDQAMKEIGRPAVQGPISLRVAAKTYELPVSAYAPALVVRVEGGELKPHLDARALGKGLAASDLGIGQRAVDARFEINGNKIRLVPSKAGIGMHPAEMARRLMPVLTESGDDRSVTIDADVVQPEFTTEEAEKLGIKEKMGEFSTFFPYAEYRNVNQGRAAELIDGTLLKPGDIFSLNRVVGQRTKANGFVKGFVIKGGVFREELGGGVSQVATTAYNAGFFAGLEDVEHHPHQLYIDRYPAGREATVYYGNLDMRFRNDTKHGVLVKAWVKPSTPASQGEMHVELWGTKVWDIEAGLSERRKFTKAKKRYDDSDKCVPSEAVKGFEVDVYRYFKRNGVRVKTEKNHVRYAATPKVICGEDPDD